MITERRSGAASAPLSTRRRSFGRSAIALRTDDGGSGRSVRRRALLAIVASAASLSIGCVANVSQAPPLPAQHERPIELQTSVSSATVIELENLVGHIRVETNSGGTNELELVGTVYAHGQTDEAARELAETIDIQVNRADGRLQIHVAYPTEIYRSFHYPKDKGEVGGVFAAWFQSNSEIKYQGTRVGVSSSRRADAASLFVDLTLRLPAGAKARITNGVGDAAIVAAVGDISLRTGGGGIEAIGGQGEFILDTGSGAVTVHDHQGDVNADTGSGAVEIAELTGDWVRVDTGSGRVRLVDVEAGEMNVDTGSGSVILERVAGSIIVDTGSGSVRGSKLVCGERLYVDTGSGSVTIAGDLSRTRSIQIDTGSGAVDLLLSAVPASMSVRLSTSSGGIDVNLPGIEASRHTRSTFVGALGGGEGAEMLVESGNGRIRVHAETGN